MTTKKDTFTATINYDFPLVEEEEEEKFESHSEYESYKSSCREATLVVVLTKLKMKSSSMGGTHAEWLRALSDMLYRGLRKKP